jgi:hypothetical protein
MPDIANKAQYEQYQADVAAFIARDGLSFLSTGTWDYQGEHDEPRPENWNDEPWFSWTPCECCGCPLGGNRWYLHARDKENLIAQYVICEDCVYYVEYGCLDDATMARVA